MYTFVSEDPLYHEKLASNKTEALFLGLTILCLGLLVWRVTTYRLDAAGAVFLFLFMLFPLYSANCRTLGIRLTQESLELRFGVFTSTTALEDIESTCLDVLPLFLRMGGAGIHFMFVHGRYRASFNFLEYPRVVVALKRKAGLVRDISFSTCHPDQVQRLIQEAVTAHRATQGPDSPRKQPAVPALAARSS